MITEMKTFRATCDRCKRRVRYFRRDAAGGLPRGWTVTSREVVYGTGYYDHCTETTHLCPGCSTASAQGAPRKGA